MSLVTLTAVSVKMAGVTALDKVDFRIEPGEIVTVVGPNGSGKTTLLRTILGAIEPSEGAIQRAPGLRIGYVPQRLHVDGSMPLTVARFLNLPRRRSRKETSAALERAGVGEFPNRQMTSLSGGQFQRVLLARALLDNPQLLVLDEPTTGLDQPGSAALYAQIEEVRSALGCAVLMVGHELHVVMSASDRVVCLNAHVCCHGTPEVVASAPEYRALFGRGTRGTLALYRHEHDHHHEQEHEHHHEHGHG